MCGQLQIALFFAGIAITAAAQGQTNNSVQNRLDSLVSQLQATEAGEQFAAVRELGELGPLAKPAVPELAKTLQSSDDLALKHEVLIALGRIGTEAAEAVPAIVAQLKSKSPVVQYAAVHALGQIGREAKAALPEITELTKAKDSLIGVSAAWSAVAITDDQKTRLAMLPVLLGGLESEDSLIVRDAKAGLVEIGKPAIPQLVPRLQRDNEVAVLVAETLANMGPDAESATKGLLSALQSQDEKVASRAARALGAITAQPETAVPSLASQLTDPSAQVRESSAMALANYGNAAVPAVPDLTRALSDEVVEVRVAAASALGAIGSEAKSAVPALNKALDDPAGIVTLSAAEALGYIKGPAVEVLASRLDQPGFLPLSAAVLGHMGPDAADAVPALVKHLNTQEPESLVEVLIALASIGPKAKAATKPLLDLAKNGEGRPQRAAVYALAKIGAKDAIPLFQQGVGQTKDPLMQRTCAWALVTLDPENAEYVELALPQLMAGLSDELPLVRKECALAIQKIGPEAKAAVPELLTALESSPSEVQTEILDALAQIGEPAKPAIPAAVKLLNSPDSLVRYTAIYLLGSLGKAAQDAAPALQKVLDGNDPFGQAVAAWALVNVDPNEENIRRATPLMLQSLEHVSPLVRAKAAEMLGKIGNGNPDVKAALQRATKDEDETVRQVAEKALSALN